MLNHDFCQSLLPFKKAKIVYTVIIFSEFHLKKINVFINQNFE